MSLSLSDKQWADYESMAKAAKLSLADWVRVQLDAIVKRNREP